MTTDVNSLFEQDAQALMAADDDLLSVAEMAQRAKALEKDRRDRYSTAGAFADDLENVLLLRPIRARPAGTLEKDAA